MMMRTRSLTYSPPQPIQRVPSIMATRARCGIYYLFCIQRSRQTRRASRTIREQHFCFVADIKCIMCEMCCVRVAVLIVIATITSVRFADHGGSARNGVRTSHTKQSCEMRRFDRHIIRLHYMTVGAVQRNDSM